MTPPIICTSEFLRTDAQTACVASAIHFALERLGIEHRELKNTNDYWIRDFMPVSILEEGVYSRYTYRPPKMIRPHIRKGRSCAAARQGLRRCRLRSYTSK